MKILIIHELTIDGETTTGEAAAILQPASDSFKKALHPLGPCRLRRITAEPSDMRIDPIIDALTRDSGH